jgi:hypothetical protein
MGNKGFFNNLELWKKEWQGMPEFIQDNQELFQSIIVHFKTKKARDRFRELIKQNITNKTRSIYFPKERNTTIMGKEYVDTEEETNEQ